MGDERELREMKSKLGKKADHLSGNALNIVLSADDDESCDLVADHHPVMGCHLILDAVQPSAILK